MRKFKINFDQLVQGTLVKKSATIKSHSPNAVFGLVVREYPGAVITNIKPVL